jgi:hypothetical protein
MRKQKKVARKDGYGGKTEVKEVSQGEGIQTVDSKGVVRVRDAKTNRVGRKLVTEDAKKQAIEAARIGIPMDKIAILLGFWGNDTGWANWLRQEPEFAKGLHQSRVAGEIAMQHTVLSGGDGWQGSAWTLERRHGCVARQQLEHSGPGGKALTIAHQVLAAVQHGERA